MYSRLPSLVIGFHGCDISTFQKVVCDSGELTPSNNNYDWLGNGIYFWEQNYDRALQWAKEQAERGRVSEPAVVGAVIDLGYCLNLTDSHYTGLLKNEYRLMKQEFQQLGLDMPKNTGRNTTAAPAEAPNTFQENFFRGSLGSTFMARITAIIMIRVTHCRWDRE